MKRNSKFRAVVCEQGTDIFSKKLCSKDGFQKVYAFLGTNKCSAVIYVGIFWAVLVFVKHVVEPVRVAVTGTRSMITP